MSAFGGEADILAREATTGIPYTLAVDLKRAVVAVQDAMADEIGSKTLNAAIQAVYDVLEGADHRASSFSPFPHNIVGGSVVLDWPLAVPILRGVGEIVAEDVDHGNDIERRLKERRGPQISVPSMVAA